MLTLTQHLFKQSSYSFSKSNLFSQNCRKFSTKFGANLTKTSQLKHPQFPPQKPISRLNQPNQRPFVQNTRNTSTHANETATNAEINTADAKVGKNIENLIQNTENKIPAEPLPETPEQMYIRLRNERLQSQEQFIQAAYSRESRKKASPFTSLPFIFIAFVLPVAYLGSQIYSNPGKFRRHFINLQRRYRLLKYPYSQSLYKYFYRQNKYCKEVFCLEVNTDTIQDMPKVIERAQQLIIFELSKGYEYLNLLQQFKDDIPELMSIPGFTNNEQAEMQTRQMKANKAQLDDFIGGVTTRLMKSLSQIESSILLDPNDIPNQYREPFGELLQEQIRLKLIDEYKVDSLKQTKQGLAERKDHTGVIRTKRDRVDKDGKVITGETERFDGEGDTSRVQVPFEPQFEDGVKFDGDRFLVESRLQLGTYRAESNLAILGEKHKAQDEAIERMSAPDYEPERIIPEGLDAKDISKYTDLELQLAFLKLVENNFNMLFTITQILDIIYSELNSQRETILKKKEIYNRQQGEKEAFQKAKANSIKSDNFFTNNSVPQEQNINPNEVISQYDFVFDLAPVLRLVDKGALPKLSYWIFHGVDGFWKRHSRWNVDKASFLKAYEQFPEAIQELEANAGMTMEEIKNQPPPEKIVRIATFPMGERSSPEYWCELEDNNIISKRDVVIFGYDV
jgi:hypothetical protein